MSRFVVALAGPIGSGVTTVATALQQGLDFKILKISDLIRRSLGDEQQSTGQRKLLTFSRKELQDHGNSKRSVNPAHWAQAAINEINSGQHGEKVIVEGVKNPHEIQCLSSEFGMQFFLVAVIASRDVRWGRVKKTYHGSESEFDRDDKRDSDEDLSFGQQVGNCVQLADYVYVNDKDFGSTTVTATRILDGLRDDIQVMESCRRVGPATTIRSPRDEETHMATAWAQSFISRCLKRQVGAVIVSEDGIPLSIGFNENPVGMDPCKHQYRACFKDDIMHRALENMSATCCPRCGKIQSALRDPWLCADCGENLKLRFFPSRNMELCTAIHAEERAVRSLMGRDAKNATLFTTTFPCFQCARYIVDCKIKRVVYVEAYPVVESKKFLELNGVKVDAFSGFKARAFNIVFKQTT